MVCLLMIKLQIQAEEHWEEVWPSAVLALLSFKGIVGR
jgi:hypothetical protein